MVRETEKPNVSGCPLNRRVRIVDLPEPEGPDITIGRWVPWTTGSGSVSVHFTRGVQVNYLRVPLLRRICRQCCETEEWQEEKANAASLSERQMVQASVQ